MEHSFAQENAFVAFLATKKACGSCRDCRKGGCHIHLSKDILTRLSEPSDKRVRACCLLISSIFFGRCLS